MKYHQLDIYYEGKYSKVRIQKVTREGRQAVTLARTGEERYL